jgi:hypothetical protein
MSEYDEGEEYDEEEEEEYDEEEEEEYDDEEEDEWAYEETPETSYVGVLHQILDKDGSPLARSLHLSLSDITRFVIDTEPNIKEIDGMSMLHSDVELTRFLLRHKGIVWSALVSAASSGHIETIQAIFDDGYDTSSARSDALSYASQSGEVRTVKFLLDHGVVLDHGSVRMAAMEGRLDVLKLFAKRGFDFTTIDCMDIAISYGQVKVVEFLLDSGVEITDFILAKAAQPPMYESLETERSDILKLLRDRFQMMIEES